MTANKRYKEIRFKVTYDQYERIAEEAAEANLDLQNFMRYKTSSLMAEDFRPLHDQLAAIHSELAAIGHNVNQAVKNYHTEVLKGETNPKIAEIGKGLSLALKVLEERGEEIKTLYLNGVE